MTPQQSLRIATRADHDAIEQDHPIGAIFDRDNCHDVYLKTILSLACWYQPLEKRLRQQPILMALPMADARWHKAEWLIADLTAAGQSADILPAAPGDLPVPGDAAGWLGVAYTLEGATLGGAVLARQIRERLGASVPCRFYQGYGDDNGRYWQAMVSYLNHHLTEPPALASAIAGARSCFAALQSWLIRSAG